MNLKKEKQAFMDYIGVSAERKMEDKLGVAMSDSINSAAKTRNPRFPLYKPQTNHTKFREAWKEALCQTAKQYKRKISENAHLKNIQEIANSLSRTHKRELHKNRLRIGISQKSLNLYLKHLWCLDKISEPPHCPLDGIILGAAGAQGSWTESDNIEEYKQWIACCKNASSDAGYRNLSEWELAEFNIKQLNGR